jgi:hypothetical protein
MERSSGRRRFGCMKVINIPFQCWSASGLGALALALGVGAAAAQGPPSPCKPLPPTALHPDKRACGQAKLPVVPQTAPKQVPGTVGSNHEKERLSDRLAESDGVICPPEGIDPEIRAPTPETGRIRVIPPPGTRDGNPNAQSK